MRLTVEIQRWPNGQLQENWSAVSAKKKKKNNRLKYSFTLSCALIQYCTYNAHYLLKDSNLMYGSFRTFIFKSLLAFACFARLRLLVSFNDDLQVLSSQACNFSVVQIGIPQVWALLSGSTVHCCGCVRARSNIASARDFCKHQQFLILTTIYRNAH